MTTASSVSNAFLPGLVDEDSSTAPTAVAFVTDMPSPNGVSSTSHMEIIVTSACMESLSISFLPLPPSHPFAKFVVFFCDSLIVF